MSSKKSKRWPKWKIVVSFACCTATSILLYLAGFMVEGQETADIDSTTQPLLDFATLLLMFSTVAGLLAVLCLIWLIYRIRLSRIPPWERGKRGKRR